ncbi:flagellar hook-basal body complex protein [Bradyrhizobium canariense]|uniref:Flagellar hook protein FlgE n=1 Tax=Bradyrhizobium canariense TaxID=255045 RepID=A0A1H1MGI6_9BRAD|nr:flagellar hook-basal body complex protein [Bradyrhizobium canariense]SDR85079.1 flagellar hook-basal body protein [Bradyrhizobium canariense]
MGIFDALNTAVGGLQSQSFALQNISGNIANASTVGYKGVNTTFEDLIADASSPSGQVAGGVAAYAQQTITTAGTVSASTVATNMAINGDGFFSVQNATGTVDGQPVFSGVTDYTRAGDFQVNANGYLVNGAGYYLMGVTVDPKTGNPLGSVPQVLQFQNNFVPAQATSALQYAANLPTKPATTASTTAPAGSVTAAGGLSPGDFGQNPMILGTPATPFGNSSVTGSPAASTAGPISTGTLLSSKAVGSTSGTAVDDQTTSPVPITGTTLLAGGPGTASLTNAFANGDTITVGTKTITFSTTAATSTDANGGVINLGTGTVNDVLKAIDEISTTGTASTVSGGKVTLNDSAGDITVTSSNTAAFTALGFSGGTVTTTAGTATGTLVNNQTTTPVPVSGTTLLSGVAGAYSLSSGFAANDTITVNGKTITFSTTAATSTSASGGVINLGTGTVQDVLTAIDEISGTTTPSTISASGVITLNDNAGSLSITSSNSSALGALGFSASTITTPSALSASFSAGDTVTVDGKTISFYDPTSTTGPTSAGSATNTTYLNLATATVGTLLTTIDSLTGASVHASISATGAITLNTGTAADLSVSSTNTSAFGALGFTDPMTAARTGGGTAGTGVVIGNDLTAFTNESISGGAVTAYNSAGTPVNLQVRWALTSTAGGQDTWNMFYQTDTSATGSQVAWVNAGTNFVFNANGSLSSPSGSAITIPGVTVNNQSLGNLTLNVGEGALTQYASTSGSATVNTFTQNGYAAGQLQSVAINNNGLVVGTFSNGQDLDLASITLSHFNGTNYLQALSGEAYAVTAQSGPAIAGASGTISGSSLEGSNTDIADEFTKLIVTQQAYSANTKVITTANDMIQSLLSVLR